MQILKPVLVNRLWVRSEDDLGDFREYFIGNFIYTMDLSEITSELRDSKAILRVITPNGLSDGFTFRIEAVRLTKGIIFESTEEAVNCLNSGLTVEDIYEQLEFSV